MIWSVCTCYPSSTTRGKNILFTATYIMPSIPALQRELIRRFRDNSYARTMLTTRGKLDTNRAALYQTSKRLYTQKQENTGKKLHLHLCLDVSRSMDNSSRAKESELYTSWLGAKAVRETFKGIATTHIYWYTDHVKYATDAILEHMKQEGIDADAYKYQDFINAYIRTDYDLVRYNFTDHGLVYQCHHRIDYPRKDGEKNEDYQKRIEHESRIYRAGLRRQFTGILASEAPDPNPDMRSSGNNNETFALARVFQECSKYPSDRHIVFLFSDGGFEGVHFDNERNYTTDLHHTIPTGVRLNGQRMPNITTEQIPEYVKESCRGKDITFIPVGICTDTPEHIFGYGTHYGAEDGPRDTPMDQQFLEAVLGYTKGLKIFR